MTPDIPSAINQGQWWEYGVLGGCVLVLGWVVWYLFRRYDARLNENATALVTMAIERAGWQLERATHVVALERVRTEFEAKHRELADRYGTALADQVRIGRENEALARREYADTLEDMANKQQASSATSVAMIDKLTDRLLIAPGPRKPGPDGRY